MDEELLISKELDQLRDRHMAIDSSIRELQETSFADDLRVMRLKREKLQLKDAIFRLEEALYPDIIA